MTSHSDAVREVKPGRVVLEWTLSDLDEAGLVVTLDEALAAVREVYLAGRAREEGSDCETLVFRRGVDYWLETSIYADGRATLDVELPVGSGWWIFRKPFSGHLRFVLARDLEHWIDRFFRAPPLEVAEELRVAGAV